MQVWLEADAPRVFCPSTGGGGRAHAVAPVRRRSHRAFDDTVACLATATAKTTVCQLLRIAWRPVIVSRVAAEAVAARDPLAGLGRIGIDEVSS